MKSFVSFFKENFMLYESVLYTDRTLFSHIFTEDAMPTQAEKAEIEQNFANDKELNRQNNDKNDLESIELIKKYKADPNSEAGIDARNEVVEKYTNLVHWLCWRAERSGYVPENAHEDNFQNGIIGLMHGIDKYDPEKGVPFFAYIRDWINAGIKNPYNMARKQSLHGDSLKGAGVSLDAKVSGSRGEYADKDTTVQDTIADTSATGNPLDAMDSDVEKSKFMEYLKRLPEKEVTAIKLYFIDGKSYKEIGDIMHMSPQATKYYVECALARIRTFAKEEGFTPEEDIKLSTLKGSGANL